MKTDKKVNTNQSNRFTNRVQPNLGWQNATQDDANPGNFRAGFGVNQDDMNVPPIPNTPVSPSWVRNLRCAAPEAPAWEYKIGIAPANSSAAQKNVQDFFLKVWSRRGWVFVSEKQGIFHFKRSKQ